VDKAALFFAYTAQALATLAGIRANQVKWLRFVFVGSFSKANLYKTYTLATDKAVSS
jgi:hypothetical protein